MSIWDDRMKNDYRALQKLCVFYEPEKIKILEKQGEPPNFYRLQISNCKGIEAVVDGSVQYRTEHILIIRNFPVDYPAPGSLPDFEMETLIFNPHVLLGRVISFFCFDIVHLDTLVKQVLDLIKYKKDDWGRGSPCNHAARKWAETNKYLFPLE
ncbi:hypothetical protein QUB56_32420 [Microcoleus sp. AR_TQ3_B6]|uniref:hypothetical protein n=1 Tax=Microcoleus sp. AR_TQ3_B6 TaxID=3055284 RepID=UPI002FD49D3F